MFDPLVGAPFAGLLLAGGGLLGGLLVGRIAFISPAIFNGPQDVSLRLIAENAVVWKVANLGFVVATILTAAGLFALPNLVGDRGSSLALAAAVGFVLAAVPWLVGLYITAAYWFTSSTSFANPAVAIARSMTNTFSGIRPTDLPGFIAAELCGAVAALMLMSWLLRAGGEGVPMAKEAQL